MIKKVLLLGISLFILQAAFCISIPDLIKNSGCSAEYPNQNLLIIFDSTSVDMQESGLSFYHAHTLYKILSAKGAKDFNVFKYGYDPLSAYVDIEKVTVYRKNGEVEELDITKVYDYPAPARMIYWGAREKMIEIGRLEPGDAIEVFLFKKDIPMPCCRMTMINIFHPCGDIFMISFLFGAATPCCANITV